MELEIHKIHHQKRSKMIVEEIVGMIASGKLEPGAQLPPERVLSEEFGVSRATLREALVALEIIGIIQMRTGGGNYVSDLDLIPFLRTISQLITRNDDLLNNLIELRILFELQAVRLIIQTDPSKAEELKEIVDEMEKSVIAGDAEKNAQEDILFHKSLYKLSGNKLLEATGEAISMVLGSSVRLNRSKILKKNNMDLLYDQHYQIFKSILKGEEDEAARILTEHLSYAKNITE